MRTSGLQIGLAALTTRGMKEPEMPTVGRLIHQVLWAGDDQAVFERVRLQVRKPCSQSPVPHARALHRWLLR